MELIWNQSDYSLYFSDVSNVLGKMDSGFAINHPIPSLLISYETATAAH